MKSKIYYISNIFYGILLFSIGLTSKVFIFSSLMSITLITLSIIGLLKTKNKKLMRYLVTVLGLVLVFEN